MSHLAKSRAIAIPVDLDSQVNNLFVKSNNVVQKTILNWRLSARNASRRDSNLTTSKDYRNIIERLQVRAGSQQMRKLFLCFNSCVKKAFIETNLKNSIIVSFIVWSYSWLFSLAYNYLTYDLDALQNGNLRGGETGNSFQEFTCIVTGKLSQDEVWVLANIFWWKILITVGFWH